MSYYVVGDIQGCYRQLATLLDKVNFDTAKDILFCVGDLVNRGPNSLETLRLLKSLDNQCVTVLGNHDIHLLSLYYGIRQCRSNDTVQDVLQAHDVDDLCRWLRKKPLLHIDHKRKFAISHAGIYPWWSLQQAQSYANEIEKFLRKEKKCIKMLTHIYGNKPSKWDESLKRIQRQRFIINAFTRMRFCSPHQHLNLSETGFKGAMRKNRRPWFMYNNPGLEDYRVIFGHWSALGLFNSGQFLCLDTGCVWGKKLTMVKIPKRRKKPVKFYKAKKTRN